MRRADITAIPRVERQLMPRRAILFPFVLFCFVTCLLPAQGQLPPAMKDPRIPGQSAPGKTACSTTAASSCAEAAAKILPIVMGSSPMEENLRRLTDEVGGRVTGTPEMAKAIQWGIAGFRAAGVDVHTEKYTLPATWKESPTRLEITAPRTTNNVQLRAVSDAWEPA